MNCTNDFKAKRKRGKDQGTPASPRKSRKSISSTRIIDEPEAEGPTSEPETEVFTEVKGKGKGKAKGKAKKKDKEKEKEKEGDKEGEKDWFLDSDTETAPLPIVYKRGEDRQER